MLRVACLLWLGLCPPARSEEQELYVAFNLKPKRAAIHHAHGTGQPGEKIPIHFDEQGQARIEFECKGYHPEGLTLNSFEIKDGWFPSEDVSRSLVPIHFYTPTLDLLRENPEVSQVGAFLGVLALTWGARSWYRRRRQRKTLQKFEARRDVHDSLAMQVVGGYLLVEALGSGGMATVYRGLPHPDLDEDKAVAVKVLGREMLDDREFRERFRREVNAYRKLTHPNIVNVYDWGELDGGMIFIVLELVKGETLRTRMVQPGFRPELCYSVLECLASALEHAHQRGIIHRDLKPENLMLNSAQQLRVMDFGLARHEGEERLTKTDVVMGTPAYMAPEQLQAATMDSRLDQYAFGVIVYELLTGHLPYASTSGMALFSEIMTGAPVPIRRHRPDLNAELEQALTKILSKSPEQRFPSVAQAWDAIKAYLPGKP